jgi:tetratricopeptide (TPR) repeat protein
VVLRHVGRIVESGDAPTRAADALRGRLTGASPPAWSVYGALQLKSAVAAATLGDHRGVQDYVREADRAAERTGERNDFWFAFGPANMAIHRVWLHLELGDPTAAVNAAERVDHRALPPELAERSAAHLITVAWAQYLRRRWDEARDALSEARSIAPEQLVFTSRVREMARGLVRRERAGINTELRALADLVGVAD